MSTPSTTAQQRVLGSGAPLVSTPTGSAFSALTGAFGAVAWGADVYQSDGQTLYLPDIDITDGNVTADYTRDERRMVDVTFSNDDDRLVHAVGQFWYDKIIKVYRGVTYAGGQWGCQVGEFMIDKIEEPDFPRTVHITGRDYTKKLLISKLAADTNFAAGLSIESVISALAINAGVDPNRMIIPTTGISLAAVWTVTAQTTRQAAIVQLANAYGYETFFDASGTFVMRPFQDPATAPQTWTFQTGPSAGNLVSWDKLSDDSDLFNHQIVYVNSSQNAVPVWGEAINTTPGSPTNTATIGDRVNPTTVTLPLTSTQATQYAQNLLAVSSLEDYEIDMSSLVFPHLEVGNVVKFVDPNPNPGEPTMFLLTSFDIPLKLGPSSPVAKRVALVNS